MDSEVTQRIRAEFNSIRRHPSNLDVPDEDIYADLSAKHRITYDALWDIVHPTTGDE